MNKKCFKCQEEKDELLFKKKKGKITTCCKLCYGRHYNGRKWAGKTRVRKLTDDQRIQKNKDNQIKQLESQHQIIFDFVKQQGGRCADCGLKNFVCIEFDHRNPKEKSRDISSCSTQKQLKEELPKCDVVCANCHRIRTAKTYGSWKLNYNL